MADELPGWINVTGAIVDMGSAVVTAAAVVVAGTWGYFRFVKSRTYRLRLAAEPGGEWVDIEGKPHLRVRIDVRNIGASVVWLEQSGTALAVSRLAPSVPGKDRRSWVDQISKQTILKDHEWIEPGERVHDELLLDLGVDAPIIVQVEARLIWRRKKKRWWRNDKNIDVRAKQILPISAVLSDTEGLE